VRTLGLPASRIQAIPNAVRAGLFTRERNLCRAKLLGLFRTIPADVPIIAAAGRLSPEKGFAIFIAAAKIVLQKFPDCHFIIFGEGKERDQLTRSIQTQSLAEKVFMAGHTDRLDELMPGCDLFVNSSYTEGLPNVLLEAAACGLPLIGTNVGGTPEIIQHGKTGVLVPAGDANSLAEAMATILMDPRLALKIGSAGRAHVQRSYSFTSQTDAYHQFLSTLLSRRQAA
jgi:glycosyltransferase involved in cell wall biosynthesis